MLQSCHQDVPFEDVITLALRGGLVIKKGEFIEDCVGKKQLFDIKTFGLLLDIIANWMY